MMWQPAPLLFPDAEEVLVQGYRDLLPAHGEASLHVGNFVPKQRPARLLVVTRDGGQVVGTRDRTRVRVRIFDKTNAATSALARKVVALTPLLVANGTVQRVQHISGPLDVTENGDSPQRYLLFEIDLRPLAQLETP